MAKAKKAQAEARKGVESVEFTPAVTPAPAPSPAVTAPVQEQVVKPKKRGIKKVETEAPVTSAAPTAAVPAPVKKKRAPKAKVVAEPAAAAVTLAPTQVAPVAIESTQDPLEGLEVVLIRVKKMEHDGTSYYLDSNKGKLYSMGADKKPHTYVGRWDPRNEIIDRDFPDSDAE